VEVNPAAATAAPLSTVAPIATVKLPPTVAPLGAATATAAPIVTPTAAKKIEIITLRSGAGPKVGESVPLYGPGYDPGDGKPVLNCQAHNSAATLVLLQMQAAGLDVKHGFHLGLIPLDLDQKYALNESDSMQSISNGTHDCILEKVDELEGVYPDFGVLTTIVAESAGDSGIWARDIKSRAAPRSSL
jgi:hypothetical protein